MHMPQLCATPWRALLNITVGKNGWHKREPSVWFYYIELNSKPHWSMLVTVRVMVLILTRVLCSCCSVVKSCLTLCDPTGCSTSGFLVFPNQQKLTRGQTRNLGKALSGSRLQYGGVRTSNMLLCLPPHWERVNWFLTWDESRNMSRGPVERGLVGLLTPLLVLSVGGLLSTLLLLTQYPASAYSVSCFLALQKWQ